MCVYARKSVNTYTFCLIYMQSLHLDFGQLMQTSSGSEKRVQSNAYAQLAERCDRGSSGAEPAWHTQGHSLRMEVSDEGLLIPIHTTTNKHRLKASGTAKYCCISA